jgi:hypothetical protein
MTENSTRKRLKRFVFIPLGVLVGLVIILFIGAKIASKPIPEGIEGPKAEDLTAKIEKAVNIEAWNELNWIQWSFPGGYSYVWDREREFVQISFDDKTVVQDLDAGTGWRVENGQKVEGSESDKVIYKSLQRFWNDSFWLAAFTKLRDEGVTRKYVQLEDGREALLVTYSEGGATPGDSYLWIVDENGRPVAWQMWVQILPIGGLETSWSDWQELHNGAMVAPLHESAMNLELTDLKSGDTWQELGLSADPFAGQ